MARSRYLTNDKEGIESFLNQFDTFIFDCDGVLWTGDEPFSRVSDTIDMLRKRGKRLIFVTNNSTKSRHAYTKKFDRLKIAVKEEDIFGSSYSAAFYIARVMKLQRPNKVYVLGEAGIEEELQLQGLQYIGGTDPTFRRDITEQDFQGIADGSLLDPDVDVVLAGLDFHPSYLKYALGLAYIRKGAVFLATNSDATLPIAGALVPGGGSSSAVLYAACGRSPLFLGKPNQAMLEAIEERFQFNRERACMVGDRLDTDIEFGIQGRLGGTLAVLTGVTKREQIVADDATISPLAYIEQLSDLLG